MFTNNYAYELKSRSVTRKTMGISLMLHALIGIILLLAPFPKIIAPQAAEPERQLIKITAPGDFASPAPSFPPPSADIPRAPRETPVVKNSKPTQEIPSLSKAARETSETASAPVGSRAIGASSTAVTTGETGSSIGSQGSTSQMNTTNTSGVPGGAGLDNVRGRFISALERNKEYPYIARKQNQTGIVGVLVSLDETGNLQNVQVTKSSGFSQLDNAAISLVRKICPFSHSAGKVVTMNISINYDLKG